MIFELKILGCNSAAASHGRHHSSQVLAGGGHQFLIDCGEGTQLQMSKFGVKKHRIKHVFISHLHGDHYFGLPGYLSGMHLQRREEALHIYAPYGLNEILSLIFKYSDTKLRYPIHFHEIDTTKNEIILETNEITVETVPLEHRIDCCGFLFKEKPKSPGLIGEKLPKGITPDQIKLLKNGKDILSPEGQLLIKNSEVTKPPKKSRSYAYCSDTAFSKAIIPIIKNVDLLYHEATFLEADSARATETFHSTAAQAAEIACKAGAGKLLLGHFSAAYKDLTPFLKEAKAVFDTTLLAEEGCIYSIED